MLSFKGGIRMKKKVVKRKVRNKYEGKMLYLRPDQDDYLLNRSIFEFGQANKKSEIVREIIDIAMETDPLVKTVDANNHIWKGGDEEC